MDSREIRKRIDLAFYLNAALGSGDFNDIPVREVKKHIFAFTIFEYLQRKLKDRLDLSLLTQEDLVQLNEEWVDLAESADDPNVTLRENGLCLLVAYLLEGIQRRLVP